MQAFPAIVQVTPWTNQCAPLFSHTPCWVTGGMRVRLCAVENVHRDSHHAFYKYNGALLLRSPEFYHSFLHCCISQALEILQEPLPTVRVEGARELRLDTGHDSHSHSSDPSVGLAQLILPTRLGCQWILHCYCYSTLRPPPPLPSPPPTPLLFLLPLRPVESLFLHLEGPLPPPALPTNYPLYFFFGFS